MDQELIVKALNRACGNKSFKFQVVIQNDQLHIYANHRADYQPNHQLLQDNVKDAIASLALDSPDSLWLYSRPLDQVQPNWKTLVKLPILENKDDEDTIGSTKELESEIDFAELEKLPIGYIYNPSDINLRENEPEFDFPDVEDFGGDDSTGDTGLLHHTGLIHSTPLKEEEIKFPIATDEGEAEVIESADLVINAPQNENNFAQYCFVTNKKLLTEYITPPEKEIIRLVKFFHHLSENNQHKLLPIFDRYFLHHETPDLEKMAVAIQKWFKQITELNFDKQHIFTIWLSRYCFAQDATLEELKTISVQHATAETEKKAKLHSTEYSFTPANSASDSTLNQSFDELNQSRWQLPTLVKKLILPSAWVVVTVILLILGIISNNSSSTVASAQIPRFCSNSLASSEYCRLAVNLVGEKKISQSSPSLFPLTEVTETVATYGCERYANLKARIKSNIAPEQTPVRASHGEQIFPHIYVITAEQKNAAAPGNTKVGCVYTTGEGQRSPKKLAADVIPVNWPSEHYQKPAGSSANLSWGIFSKPISLGLYTIFAALGIAIANWSNLGIKMNRRQTIYLLALVLGIVQVVVASMPFLGMVGAVTFPIVAIFTASLVIKDLQINWKRGYPLIAMLMIVAIQFLLYGLCLGLINSFV